MKAKREDLEDWINRCLDEGKGLSDWETNFLESVAEQLDNRGWLSDKQVEIVERIYTEKTK